uniref:Uncharacterized protein n=1 Tax=Hyaloperonospora arabidopsidis (strain Emoy2) TaxID=559515 RepID=M4B1D5_HYAAE
MKRGIARVSCGRSRECDHVVGCKVGSLVIEWWWVEFIRSYAMVKMSSGLLRSISSYMPLTAMLDPICIYHCDTRTSQQLQASAAPALYFEMSVKKHWFNVKRRKEVYVVVRTRSMAFTEGTTFRKRWSDFNWHL